MTGLAVQGISFSYGRRRVLDRLSLKSQGSEFLAVVGPNGSGKTTLFRCITGFLQLGQGRVLVGGREIGQYARKDLARRIAVVPQISRSHFGFTCQDVVATGRIPYLDWLSGEHRSDRAAVEEAMRETDVWGLRGRLFSRISGGEQQRVIVARALAQEPEILLLDEPTAHLDIAGQIEVMSLIRSLADRRSLLAVAAIHDINLAAQYCQRAALLNNGSIESIGGPGEVFTEENIERAFGFRPRIEVDGETGLPYLIPVRR